MTPQPWEQLTTLSNQFTGQDIEIGENVTIHPSAVIEGPVKIGDNCVIGVGAYVRPYTIMGKNCVIGHASEVKHSILGDHVVLPHFNYVGDSILGDYVHLGGGAMLANFKSDGSTIKVTVGDKKVDTGLKKFGAVLGNHVEIGGGAILNPGTIVGEHTTIYPGACIRGSIPANSIVKVRTEQEIVPKQ
jgi:NDP-sugar pyrophosphorylase family protein